MPSLFNIIMLLCLIAIPTLHTLCAIFPKRAKLMTILCLALHITALLPLLYFGATLEFVFMLYVISLALRQLLYLVLGKRGDKRVL